jgi:hypothetical protein
MQLIQTHIVLNPTNVGRSFLLLAHISDKLVNSVRKNNHHTEIPNINPGTMITALAAHDRNSTVL